MKHFLKWLFLVSLFITGCSVPSTNAPQRTQLGIRQMQTRVYESKDTKMIMKAMLNVLQDDSFIIKQVNMDLGFLNAVKETDVEDRKESFWQKFWYGQEYAIYKKNALIDCTVNISEFGDKMRVRTNFQVKVINNKGGYVSVQPIDDPGYYQTFFAKVDKGIFIEDELYTYKSSVYPKSLNVPKKQPKQNLQNISTPKVKKKVPENESKIKIRTYSDFSDAELKVCYSCNQAIETLDDAHLFKDKIVCTACEARLAILLEPASKKSSKQSQNWQVKIAAFTEVDRTTEIKTIGECFTCKRVIGKLERSYTFGDYLVCGDCYVELKNEMLLKGN